MRTRETSRQAYRELIEGGQLAATNRAVYKHLFKYGPTTQKKTERFLGDRTYTIRPRFAQLERMGLITLAGQTVCQETGKKNLLWDVTDRVKPIELPNRPLLKKQILDRIQVLNSRMWVDDQKNELLLIYQMIKEL